MSDHNPQEEKSAPKSAAQAERQAQESRLFRKTAIDRLSSPDQLDQLMRVTSPMGWLAFIGAGIIIASALVWSIFGSIPIKVTGKGIMIRRGGVMNVSATASGQLVSFRLQPGDLVMAGETVAVIAQQELLNELAVTERSWQEKRAAYDEALSREATLAPEYKRQANAQQRQNLQATIDADRRKLVWLNEKLQQQQGLLADGLITKQTMLQTQTEIEATNADIRRCQVELTKLSADDLDIDKTERSDLRARREAFEDVDGKLRLLRSKIELGTQIAAPVSGHVLEIKVKEGDILTQGCALFSLEAPETGFTRLAVVVFVPAAEGKLIAESMAANIAPSVAKKEEYGFIDGVVAAVSRFPATKEGMMRVLRNESLVSQLAGSGVPLEILVSLQEDSRTVSGYHWSSSGGYPHPLVSGTLCDAEIIVERRRPITLVMPILKHYLGF